MWDGFAYQFTLNCACDVQKGLCQDCMMKANSAGDKYTFMTRKAQKAQTTAPIHEDVIFYTYVLLLDLHYHFIRFKFKFMYKLDEINLPLLAEYFFSNDQYCINI